MLLPSWRGAGLGARRSFIPGFADCRGGSFGDKGMMNYRKRSGLREEDLEVGKTCLRKWLREANEIGTGW